MSRKSKVKEYIDQVKRSDRTAAEALTNQHGHGQLGTLEDLYGIDDLASQTSSVAKTELRKTLRELKEKDLLILKLREACHDLTLKYADAENTIDQLRFGTISTSKGSTAGCRRGIATSAADSGYGLGGSLVKSRSAFCLAGSSAAAAAAAAAVTATSSKIEKRDQETTMSPIPEPLKSFLQTTNDEYNNSWSSYDVLDESCSNWMEKVQNWKTADSLFNTSADADSGFRGSDVNTNTVAVGTATGANAGVGDKDIGLGTPTSLLRPMAVAVSANTNTNSSSGSRNNFGANSQTQFKNLAAHRPALSPISAFSMHKNKTAVASVTRGTNTEEIPEPEVTKHEERIRRHSKSSQVNLVDAVEQIPEPAVSSRYQRVKSQSYDNLRAINQRREHEKSGAGEPSSKDFTPYYSKRLSMSHVGAGGRYYSESTTYFKSLDPLLDDATRLAKRVQYKSQKLARQLQQTLNESKSKRK